MAPSTTAPSLNHVMVGVGEPVAMQVRLIGSPAVPTVG